MSRLCSANCVESVHYGWVAAIVPDVQELHARMNIDPSVTSRPTSGSIPSILFCLVLPELIQLLVVYVICALVHLNHQWQWYLKSIQHLWHCLTTTALNVFVSKWIISPRGKSSQGRYPQEKSVARRNTEPLEVAQIVSLWSSLLWYLVIKNVASQILKTIPRYMKNKFKKNWLI